MLGGVQEHRGAAEQKSQTANPGSSVNPQLECKTGHNHFLLSPNDMAQLGLVLSFHFATKPEGLP